MLNRPALVASIQAANARRAGARATSDSIYTRRMLDFLRNEERPSERTYLNWPHLYKQGQHSLSYLGELEDDPYDSYCAIHPYAS